MSIATAPFASENVSIKPAEGLLIETEQIFVSGKRFHGEMQ